MYLLISASETFPLLISSDFIRACSDKISLRVARIIKKKATEEFSSFQEILSSIIIILVAKAVLPIDGLPAKISKSDLCNPPIF